MKTRIEETDSPYLDGELAFVVRGDKWSHNLANANDENPFRNALEQNRTSFIEPEQPEEESVVEDEVELDKEFEDELINGDLYDAQFDNETAAKEQSIFATVDEVEGLEIETEIFGTNDMTLVSTLLDVPYRWICRLDIKYEITPWGGSSTLNGSGSGTGTLIGARHVLTAAHNIRSYDSAGKNYVQAKSVKVTPAHDGSATPPVASVEANLSKSYVHPRYEVSRRVDAKGAPSPAGEVETNQYDYALLTLKTPIGGKHVKALKGPLGCWEDKGSGGDAQFRRLDPKVLAGNDVFVAGYGYDACVKAVRVATSNNRIPLGSQLKASGRLMLIRETLGRSTYVSRSMAHNVDTCGGQSGAPVWFDRDKVFDLVGVHTGAVNMTDGSRVNHAVRVTDELVLQIRKWQSSSMTSSEVEQENVDEDPGMPFGDDESLLLDGESLFLDEHENGGPAAAKKSSRERSGVDRLLAFLPKRGGLVNYVFLVSVVFDLMTDAEAGDLASAIAKDPKAQALIAHDGVWGLVGLFDTAMKGSLDLAAAKRMLDRPRAHRDLYLLARAPPRMPGDWEHAWFTDLDYAFLRSRKLRSGPPGFAAVKVHGKSSIGSITVRFASDTEQDLDEAKAKLLYTLHGIASDVKLMKAANDRAPLDKAISVPNAKNPLPILIAAPPPWRNILAPAVASVYVDDADVGDLTKRVAAIRWPKMTLDLLWSDPLSAGKIAPIRIRNALLHELLHAFLIRSNASAAAIWEAELQRLALDGPTRVVRTTSWLLYFHLLAQEELIAYKVVAKLYPPIPQETVKSYEEFLTESWKYFKSRGATRRTVSRTIGNKVKWMINFESPSNVEALGYGDLSAMWPAWEIYPKAS